MAAWDVSDVVELLKTFGLSREVLIFVFRHNIDGATMDESVELLVKDFQLDDEDLEYQIIDKWKDISRKSLSPAQVLVAEFAQVEAPIKNATVQSDEREEYTEGKGDPPPPVFTHLRTSAWSRSGKFSAPVEKDTSSTVGDAKIEYPDDEIETPPAAVFTHLRTSAWSRSVKFAPSEAESETATNTNNIPVHKDEPALEKDTFRGSPTNEPTAPLAETKPVDVTAVIAPALDPFHFVNQVLAGFHDLPSIATPVAEPVVVAPVESAVNTVKQEEKSEPGASNDNVEEEENIVTAEKTVVVAEADKEEEDDYNEENNSEINKVRIKSPFPKLINIHAMTN